MFTYVVILAGGAGTRLWPASTASNPKQFLPLPDGSTFFLQSLDRAAALAPERGVLVVTGASQAGAVVRECRNLPKELRGAVRVLPEPAARNTAPAVAWALAWARADGAPPDASMILMTSDHLIGPLGAFAADAGKAEALARDGRVVCFGVPPRYAATGYGYVEAAEPLGPGRKAASFREKPDLATAEAFLSAGNFFWNSGMYAFRADVLAGEFREHAPEIPEAFGALRGSPREEDADGVRTVGSWEGLEQAYSRSPSISLDYAVSEKSRRMALVEASFSWDDVGSWDEMARLYPEGSGEVYAVHSGNCYVHSDIPVALCGVSDLSVVIRNGAALILRRGSSQLVKDAVEAVKAAGRKDLL